MENFNIKRFGNTFKWLFCENRGRLLAWTAGFALGVFAIQSLFLWMMVARINGLELNSEIVTGVCTPITKIGCYVALLLGFCQIFSTLRLKQKRIAYLTLPATNLERYLAAFIMATVVWTIFILLAAVLGDTLRMVFFGLLGKGWVSGIGAYFSSNHLDLIGSSKVMNYAYTISVWLWTCSFYVLGGTLFRKREFLFTTLIQIVLFTGFIWLCKQLGSNFFEDPDIIVKNVNAFSYVVVFGLLALSILNIWGSYQLFKCFQIITSKWTNV